MITAETLEKLALQYRTAVFPNVVREYFQHVFLAELYKLPESEKLLFKGGTALRIVYGSPRFSEDMDFSLSGVRSDRIKPFVEDLFLRALAAAERVGIRVEIGAKSGATSGGYFGTATFRIHDYRPTGVEINVSARRAVGRRGEVESVASDFVPSYTLVHLPQIELVDEKVFGALMDRKKPRDFYDLYFIMRKGMLSQAQKRRLAGMKDKIIAYAKKIDFRRELGAFLPADQNAVARDFERAFAAELSRQIGR